MTSNSYKSGGVSRAGKERASLARCVGRGVGEVGVGIGHASLESYEGGGVSRAGKERASLALEARMPPKDGGGGGEMELP